MEARGCEIWKGVLGLGDFSIDDDFFDLGGHSLAAMRVAARISEGLGLDVPLETVLEFSTVAALATEVEALRSRTIVAARPVTSTGSSEAPATLLQHHLWLVHQAAADTSFLNIASGIVLRGPLDIGAAEQALRKLGERHRILESSFEVRDRVLWVRSGGGAAAEVLVEDLRRESDDCRRSRLDDVRETAARSFDLTVGPCARFVLVRLEDDHHLLFMVAHHMVVDESSFSTLQTEFLVDYEAFAAGRQSSLPKLSLTFVDYAVWERASFADRRAAADVLWWRDTLKRPLPPLVLPWRQVPSVAQPAVSYSVEIDASLVAAVTEAARRERTSPFVVFLSALQRLLHDTSGGADIRIATNVSTRHRAGVEHIVGPLTDTLVLRTKLEQNPTAISALRQARATFVAACGHRELPFEAMASVLERDGIRRRELAQAFFLFADHGPEVQTSGCLTVGPEPIGTDGSFFESAMHDYALILYLVRAGDTVRGQLTLKGHLGGGAIATALLRDYDALLAELADDRRRRYA
jgi:acyl carrier protein